MKYKLLLILFLSYIQCSFGQWTDLNTGINDNLSGVVFYGNNGLVSGEKGLYYTLNGGIGPSSWNRFQINSNPIAAAVYENTNFKHCYSRSLDSGSIGDVFACGVNKLTNKPVIIKVSLPSLSYAIIYEGAESGCLNKINSYGGGIYYAVGDNGLIVKFTATQFLEQRTLGTDNLNSIAFKASTCKIAANNKILYNSDLDQGYSFVETLTAGSSNKDLEYDSNTNIVYSTGNNYWYSYNTDSPQIYSYYDFGPLNGNSVFAKNGLVLIGTDHGIFRASNANRVLEWQPSSLNNSINEFWNQITTNDIFACGNNGVLLKSSNNGGQVKPYVQITSSGACTNISLYLTAVLGTSSTCTWMVNNQVVRNTCGNYNYAFSAPGQYEVKLTVSNGSTLTSTDTKIINVVDVPSINKPVTISDAVLCHSESIQVQIENSEPGIVYTLRKKTTLESFGKSEVGDGGTISFTTNPISSTGDYFIQARHVLGSCDVNFTDVIPIVVEQTKADFYADLINAKKDEIVTFYGKTIDSQNYQWTFSPNENVSSTNLINTTAAFTSTGPVSVNLNVWSNNSCYDQIDKNSASFVYTEPSNPDNCWTIVNRGDDLTGGRMDYWGINHLEKTTDGFLVCGMSEKNQTFKSNIGQSSSLNSGYEGYLTKYDKNGVLKWLVRGGDEIYSTATDQQGNIYVAGRGSDFFYDNTGTKVRLTPPTSSGWNGIGYIIKLDAKGKYIWSISSFPSDYKPLNVYVDKQNNLIVTGYIADDSESTSSFQLYFNGVPSTVISQPLISDSSPYVNFTMLKIAPNGNVLWQNAISLSNTNGAAIKKVGFDRDNNIYLLGQYEYYGLFYSVGNPNPQFLQGMTYGETGGIQFLVKYNSSGILQWKTRSLTQDGSFENVHPFSMDTDDDGYCYITGKNSCWKSTMSQYFENPDGSKFTRNVGSYYVMKVNSDGFCQWINGDKFTDYSSGYKILKNGNLLHVFGNLSLNQAQFSTSLLTSSDNQNYSLTNSRNDIFMATYDLQGNLLKVSTNGDNTSNTLNYLDVRGAFKGDGDSFYLARFLGVENFSNYGDVITTNGKDGVISKFNEDCGVVHYQKALSNSDFLTDLKLSVYPNPTSGNFNIDLVNHKDKVQVILYDVLGKKLEEKEFFNVTKLDSAIKGNKGVYILKVIADNQTMFFKVIKQ